MYISLYIKRCTSLWCYLQGAASPLQHHFTLWQKQQRETFLPLHTNHGGQWEVRMVDNYTGKTQAKNKSQTPLTSPGTNPLPCEVLTLIRSTFVVSQACTSDVLQKFSKASGRGILTFVAQPQCCWGCHRHLQQLTLLDTAGHTWLQECSNHLRKEL